MATPPPPRQPPTALSSFLLLFLVFSPEPVSATFIHPSFGPSKLIPKGTTSIGMNAEDNMRPCDLVAAGVHPSVLPGDPSLAITTNVDVGEKKLEVMQGEIHYCDDF